MKFIGIKKSEKLYEELLTTEEAKNAVETKDFIIVNEKFDLKINQKMYKGRKLYNNRILNSKTVKLLNQNQILNYLLKKSFYKKLDQMKNILGIQWGDTATVSAIKNGRVISAIAEEDLQEKNDMSFPIKSINFCKKSLNNKVDLVAIASKKFDYITTLTHFYSIPTNEMFKIQDEYYYPLFYKTKKKIFLNY